MKPEPIDNALGLSNSMIVIDFDAVEAETAKKLRHRTELNRLIYHTPLDYTELILNL